MFKLTQKKRALIREEVDLQYSRSSGPGGQKVNKTETQVEARFEIESSGAFNREQKDRLLLKLQNKVTKDGALVVTSQKFRSRPQNQKACLEKLFETLEQALTREKPRKRTRPTKSSVEKRINEKKKRGEKKRNRQKV